MFLEFNSIKFFYLLPTCIIECVSEYILIVSRKLTQTHTQKKSKRNYKRKETKEEREQENLVAVNSICGKSYEVSQVNLP